MIIAMISVRMMQTSIDEIVNVVAMRNRLVTAAGGMPMSWFMSACPVLGRTPIRVRCSHFENVFLGTPIFYMMQMAMIEIINVVAMLNADMAAAWAVNVRTSVSRLIGGHSLAFPAAAWR